MPKRCCAAGCGNTKKDGFNLFKFPKDRVPWGEWEKQVRRRRDKWGGATEYVHLCHLHSTEECFDPTVALKANCNVPLQLQRKLVPEAIPTIFPNSKAEEMYHS